MSDAANGTRLELLGASVVWGPNRFLFVNGIYQWVRLPTIAHTFGIGVSLGGNVGGATSGVDSWARVSLDALFLVSHTVPAPGVPDRWDAEARLSGTFRLKLFGGATGAFALGPRILTSDPSHPALLATVGVTYDADQLVDQILAPRLP